MMPAQGPLAFSPAEPFYEPWSFLLAEIRETTEDYKPAMLHYLHFPRPYIFLTLLHTGQDVAQSFLFIRIY